MRVRAARLVAAAAAVAATVVSASPASAVAKPPATHVVVHVSPATALDGSIVTVTGSVTPASSVTKVVLQQRVGRTWVSVASRKPLQGRAFVFFVRAPRKAGTWALRVVRPAAGSARPGVSGTAHVRVTKTAYAVSAVPTPGTSLVVSGDVRPGARGSVQLQLLTGTVWRTMATATLSPESTYGFQVPAPPGSYRLRVVKAYSATAAGGTSNAVTEVVTPPPPPPAPVPPVRVTTANLPVARVAVPYSVTLTATGGTGPLSWTASRLPAGLALSPTGTISGTPTTKGTVFVSLTAADPSHREGSVTLALVVAPRAGRLYAWGVGAHGELGNSTTAASSPVPVPVTGMTSVTSVVAGSYDGYALLADGTVDAWGENAAGELGNAAAGSASTVPVPVTGLSSVTAIAAGGLTAFALRSDATVWAWGLDNFGQLADGATSGSRSTPAQVPQLSSISAIASADYTGYALRTDGTVWAWGSGLHGALGNGGISDTTVPVQVHGLDQVTAIAAANHTAYALRQDGTVWAWGEGSAGALGDGAIGDSSTPVPVTGISTAVGVAAGGLTGLAVLSNGTVWSWGDNDHGQLGNGSASAYSTAPVRVTGVATATAVTAGAFSGYALLADGTAVSWGENTDGELGNGTATSTTSAGPVSALTTAFVMGSSGGGATAYALQAG